MFAMLEGGLGEFVMCQTGVITAMASISVEDISSDGSAVTRSWDEPSGLVVARQDSYPQTAKTSPSSSWDKFLTTFGPQ